MLTAAQITTSQALLQTSEAICSEIKALCKIQYISTSYSHVLRGLCISLLTVAELTFWLSHAFENRFARTGVYYIKKFGLIPRPKRCHRIF